jgi:septum site-determining protein MinD
MSQNIVIFSTKGGVGRTLVAANLSIALAQATGKKILFIDLDLEGVGDSATSLNAPSKKSLLDLSEALQEPQKKIYLPDFVTALSAAGIFYLPAVLSRNKISRLDNIRIKSAIDLLEKSYDYIVIDAGRSFTSSLLAALNHANLILLVATPDILSVYQTKWSLDILQSLRIPMQMVKVILNRAQSLGSVGWQEVRAALPCEIIGRIPSDGKPIGLALNQRTPVIISSPGCKASQALKKLGRDLAERKNLFFDRREVSLAALGEEGALLKEEKEFWQKFRPPEEEAAEQVEARDEVVELKRRIHQKLIEKLDLRHAELDMSDPVKAQKIRKKTEAVISDALAEEAGAFLASFEVRNRLIKEIADEALGLGPLEDLVGDSEISDIMVNNKNQIYIERFGKIELSPKRFLSNEHVRQIIERIIAPLGRRIDESVPMVDARLPDGSRVNAIIPPLSLTGPTLTIRKFGRERLTVENLLGLNALSEPMKEFLASCILARKNTIVSGGTGSGKTTMLNALSVFIPPGERIVTIEDAAELKLSQEHWVRLESRPPNIEGKGAITTRDLFRNSLRMRPDRIIIGECRGAETLDMLQAMNTGHDGSLTTIHANSTHDVLVRLDSMILMSGVELPIRAIREMIASAIDIIIHTARLSDGSRKIMQVTEVRGMKDEMHVELQDIFVFKQTGLDSQRRVLGDFAATGYIPSFLEDIRVRGIPLSENIFKAS